VGDIRPDASVVWTPQPTPDWNNTLAGINGKHQDADGSGLVDEADLDIVEVNYRKTNADYQYEFYQNDALQVTPQVTQAENFASSSSYEIDINLGNNAQGAASIHGVSFSIDLSRLSDVESYTTEISNTNSWLAPSNIIRDITAIQNDGTILNGEDVFIGSYSSGSGEGIIPGLEFQAVAYAAPPQKTCLPVSTK